MQNLYYMIKRIEAIEQEVAALKAIATGSDTTSEFVTFSDVKKILGLGDKLTRKLVRQGRIPVIRVGPRKCLFSRSAVISAMKATQEGGTL